MRTNSTAAQRGVTLIEIMVTVGIMAIIALVTIPKLMDTKAAADLEVVRAQSVTLQTAVDSWLTNQASIGAARTTFNPDLSASLPVDTSAFLTTISAQMDTATAANYTMAAGDGTGTHIVTQTMSNYPGWYVRILWPGPTYRTSHPQIDLVTP